jgi:hypothetical protein
MKIKSLFVAVLLMAGIVVAPAAQAIEKPVIESFTFTPSEVEISNANTNVEFTVVVSHPGGIDNLTSTLKLTNGLKNTLSLLLKRADTPINLSLTKVTFKGLLTIPRDLTPGSYVPTISSFKNNASAGYQFETGDLEGPTFRSLKGAENSLLVRSNGFLDFGYQTFVGPTFDNAAGLDFDNKIKYNAATVPILRVGETFIPDDFYEKKIASLPLKISSSTLSVCSSDGLKLKFLAEGACTYSVFTERTKDYAEKKSTQVVSILSSRIKPSLIIDKVADQTVTTLPKTIELPRVFTAAIGYVMPTNATPEVCYADGFFVRLIMVGTCSVKYQTTATTTYVASDAYTLSFNINKEGQPVVVPTPVATPTPTATPKPVIKKTISCVKGTKTIKKTAISPKCPAGYKVKK